ncbi:MAG TPA: FAD-dependent oxidoreductase [Polyangiaceae bacterium]|nr:FAD-dependent oxidoreductase [Polyangiaceae bacterium]
MTRIGIIGGGLSGLTVALRRAIAGDDVVLLEAVERLGGQLHSERTRGFVVEHGAEGFVARSTAVPELSAVVGLADELVDQRLHNSYGFDGSALHALAPGEAARFLGFQVGSDELGRGIRSFRSGMQTLSDGLARFLAGRAELRVGTRVERLERDARGWRLLCSGASESLVVDALVLATTAADAARLLSTQYPGEAAALARASTVSSLTVSLAFRREQVEHPLDGTGFVVATEQQQQGFRACTFSSSKLPARAPDGYALLRLFFRPESEDLARLTDADWVERGTKQLARVIAVRGPAESAWVSRWPSALPVFDSAHRERVEALEAALSGQNLYLAGAAFHGSGIDAAVRSAEHTARALGGAP